MDYLIKKKKEFKNLKKQETQNIFRNEVDKVCFQHDLAYGDFKDLAKRTASDKVLRDKLFNFAKNLKYDGYQRSLASTVYKFFDKKSVGSSVTTLANKSTFNNEIKQNVQLANQLHKLIIKN